MIWTAQKTWQTVQVKGNHLQREDEEEREHENEH